MAKRRRRKWDIVFDGTEVSWDHTLRMAVHGLGWTVDKSAGWGMIIQPQPPVCSQGSSNPEYFMALPSTKRLQNWLGSFGRMCSLKVRVQKQTGKQKQIDQPIFWWVISFYILSFNCSEDFQVILQKIWIPPNFQGLTLQQLRYTGLKHVWKKYKWFHQCLTGLHHPQIPSMEIWHNSSEIAEMA